MFLNFLKYVELVPAKYEGCVVVRERVTECGDVAVAEPPGVVHLVRGDLVPGELLLPRSRSLELPVVEAVEEHLGQVIHHLPLLWREMIKLVQHKVGHPLGDAGLLIRGIAQGPLHTGLSSLQDASSKQFEQIKIHLLGVLVLLLVDAHEQVLHIHHYAQQPVQLLLGGVAEVTHVGGEGVAAGAAGVTGRAGGLGRVGPRRIRRRVWILPSVTLTRLVLLAGAVDGELLHLLVLGPLPDALLPLLDPLEVALPLLVGVLAPLPRGVALARGAHADSVTRRGAV